MNRQYSPIRQELIDRDWPDFVIDKKAIEESLKYSNRFEIRDNTRLATGRVFTTQEYEAWRNRVLSTPLP